MNISKNGIIVMNKGDTWECDFPINLGTSVDPSYYTPEGLDNIYFGVMEAKQPFKDSLICKKLEVADTKTIDDIPYFTVSFKTSDTERVLPGTYYYEVKLARKALLELNSGDEPQEVVLSVNTIIKRTKFIIID